MSTDPTRSKPVLLFLLTLLLLTSPLPSNSLRYQTLFSVSHPLLIREANHRASLGDLAGSARVRMVADLADRVRMVAEKLERGGLSWWFIQYQTLFSLSHSLLIRVADLRASRGDLAGSARVRMVADLADRVRMVAERLERGGFGWGFMGSIAWDYAAGRDLSTFETFVSDIDELMGFVKELTRVDSEGDSVASGNYSNVLRVSKSVFGRLLKVFGEPGPVRELLETLQIEVVEGDLLRDCLEIGSNDVKALIQVFKDITLHLSSSYSAHKKEHKKEN